MKASKLLPALAIVGALTFSCKDEKESTEVVEEKDYPGLELGYMDTSVSPKNDFYRYVNGKWLDSIQIPNLRRNWARC